MDVEPMQITSATQPETIGRLLRRSLTLYRAAFRHIVLLAFVVAITAFIPRLLAIAIGQDLFLDFSYFTPYKLWLLVIDITSLIFFTAILWSMQCVLNGDHETIADDMKIALKKIPLIIVAAFIQMLMVGLVNAIALGLYLLLKQHNLLLAPTTEGVILTSLVLVSQFVIDIYLFFLLIFYLPLILTENAGIISSLKRTILLVWNNWWLTFWVQSFPWVCYFFALCIIKFVAQINIHIFFIAPVERYSLLATILHIFLFAIFIPWSAATLLVQLRDLELRKQV